MNLIMKLKKNVIVTDRYFQPLTVPSGHYVEIVYRAGHESNCRIVFKNRTYHKLINNDILE